ncbi:hypothetical protein MBR_08962, partial [Metarhizium brunneum ARSEF 3297]
MIDTAVQGNIKTLSEIPTSTIKDGISKRFKQEMSWKTIRRDYGGYTQAINNHGADVHTMASQLRESPVITRSLILLDRYSAAGRKLRAGIKGHPKEYAFITERGKAFRKARDHFPLFFPDHDLVGRNHGAPVDDQQLRLVTMAFEEACRWVARPGRT